MTSPEFDDESPTDPSFDFDLPSDLGAPAEDTPHNLPLGPDFVPSEDEPESSDDAVGFDDAVEPADPTNESDAREHEAGDGFDDDLARLEEHELPRLDGDEGTDLDESSFGTRLESADETALPLAARPWHVDFLAPDREHCGALTRRARCRGCGLERPLLARRGPRNGRSHRTRRHAHLEHRARR